MRYKIIGISCFVLIGGMFVFPAIIWAIFLPSLKQGLPNPLPAYERILLETTLFCDHWKWLLAFPMVVLGLVFTIVGLASSTARG